MGARTGFRECEWAGTREFAAILAADTASEDCACSPYDLCVACVARGYRSAVAGFLARMAVTTPADAFAQLVSDYGEVFACSPRTAGWHVHTSACVVFRRDAGPRCVHCGEMTVRADLGPCHMVSGTFYCPGRKTCATVRGDAMHTGNCTSTAAPLECATCALGQGSERKGRLRVTVAGFLCLTGQRTGVPWF